MAPEESGQTSRESRAIKKDGETDTVRSTEQPTRREPRRDRSSKETDDPRRSNEKQRVSRDEGGKRERRSPESVEARKREREPAGSRAWPSSEAKIHRGSNPMSACLGRFSAGRRGGGENRRRGRRR